MTGVQTCALPIYPRVTSPLVAYLASDASSWLSGQVLRVSGNTIMRVEGWKVTSDQYVARSGEFFEADELVDGLRRTYGVIPRGIASPLKSEKLGVTVQGV